MDGLAALAILGSGAISTAGQLYANASNLAYNKMVNDVNWQIAAMNNQTQIDLANSAHQREVRDLRAAGLNPILSAGGSGAVTPSLQGANMKATSIENPVEGIANSAKELGRYVSRQYDAQVSNLEEQNKILDREAYKSSMESSHAKTDAELQSIDNNMRLEALNDLAFKYEKDPNGVWQQVLDKDSPYYKDYKKGIAASAALNASQYWRKNFDTAVQGINSGVSLYNAIRSPVSKTSILKGIMP